MRKEIFTNIGYRVRGAALVEYGILVGLIAVLAIGAVLALGGSVQGTFYTVSDTLSASLETAKAGGAATETGAEGEAVPTTPPVEVFTVLASTNGVGDNAGACNHGNCYAQNGTLTQTLQTNWNLAGAWTQGGTFTLLIRGFHKASIDAAHDYEISCGGAAPFPMSDGYFATQQGAGITEVTYVNMAYTGTPFTVGETTSCEIMPLS